jgi:4-aminobutyrate aminotransferase-like enzyme
VLDVDGNRYLDLTSGFGVALVGHRHPSVVAAIKRQAGRLIHGLGDAQGHPLRVELAAALAHVAPVAQARVAFAISGADAVELAVKTALLATKRRRILVFQPSYHGLTLGALALSSRRHFRAGFESHLHNYVTRLAYGCAPRLVARELDSGEFAAVVVEPVVGREGVVLPPPGWLPELSAQCRRSGTLMVADEVLTGGGRTGHWFAVNHEVVEPDLVCCGKALGGGLPVAAVVGRAAVMAAWDAPGEARHTATFVAHPLACAASLATLEVIAREGLIGRAEQIGALFASALGRWPSRFEGVRAVHGRGALWGIEWHSKAVAASFADRLLRRGVLVLRGGPKGRVTQLLPPLVATDRQLEFALSAAEDAAE